MDRYNPPPRYSSDRRDNARQNGQAYRRDDDRGNGQPRFNSIDRNEPYRFGKDGGSFRAGDSYHPDFSFRPSPNAPSTDFRASPPRGPRAQRREFGRDRKPRTNYQKHPATAARPLLSTRRSRTPEQMVGMDDSKRFKNVDDLSNSDGEDMDQGSDIDLSASEMSEGEVRQPSKKRIMSMPGSAAPMLDPIPQFAPQSRWSNPDPYTALPPADDVTGKRTDFVRLIRKAKADTDQSINSAADGNDFISFGGDDVEPAQIQQVKPISMPTSKSKFSHLDNLHPNRAPPGTMHNPMMIDDLGPPPAPPSDVVEALRDETRQSINIWPPPPSIPKDLANDNGRGTKRGRDVSALNHDEDDHVGRSRHEKSIKGKKSRPRLFTVSDWEGRDAPWQAADGRKHEPENVAVRLHMDILDFYEYVKPREFEHHMRQSILVRVQRFLDSESIYHSLRAEVRPFGSYAAGIYLPTADMDLVVLSERYLQSGPRMVCQSNKAMREFARRISHPSWRIVKPGSIVPILHAKVPIVKYVDAQTGVRVDISFENKTGIVANKTYDAWKIQYPAMPIIVTLLKQFLAMRGQNEVFNGGLGGMSVTCMVVSLLQHMPQVQSGNMDPMQNLGEIFMTFLDFYGNKFNLINTGIQLDPPAYFKKNQYMHFPKPKHAGQKMGHLSIADPNNPSNDISAGTRNIVQIFREFSDAFSILREDLSNSRTGQPGSYGGSALSSLYAGNYSSFEKARSHLKRLYTESLENEMSNVTYESDGVMRMDHESNSMIVLYDPRNSHPTEEDTILSEDNFDAMEEDALAEDEYEISGYRHRLDSDCSEPEDFFATRPSSLLERLANHPWFLEQGSGLPSNNRGYFTIEEHSPLAMPQLSWNDPWSKSSTMSFATVFVATNRLLVAERLSQKALYNDNTQNAPTAFNRLDMPTDCISQSVVSQAIINQTAQPQPMSQSQIPNLISQSRPRSAMKIAKSVMPRVKRGKKPKRSGTKAALQRGREAREIFPFLEKIPQEFTKKGFEAFFKQHSSYATAAQERSRQARVLFPHVEDLPLMLSEESFGKVLERYGNAEQRAAHKVSIDKQYASGPNRSRAQTLKQLFPNVPNIPHTTTKEEYKNFVENAKSFLAKNGHTAVKENPKTSTTNDLRDQLKAKSAQDQLNAERDKVNRKRAQDQLNTERDERYSRREQERRNVEPPQFMLLRERDQLAGPTPRSATSANTVPVNPRHATSAFKAPTNSGISKNAKVVPLNSRAVTSPYMRPLNCRPAIASAGPGLPYDDNTASDLFMRENTVLLRFADGGSMPIARSNM